MTTTRPTLAAALALALAAVAPTPTRATAPAGQPARPPRATAANLQRAYESDLRARARYLAFAEQADREGYRGVARLFRTGARSEEVRARTHAEALTQLGGTPKPPAIGEPTVKGTRQNLLETLAYENAERVAAYPGLAEQARNDKAPAAVLSFTLAHDAEDGLVKRYQEALAILERMREPGSALHVCTTCGHVAAAPEDRCPVCHAPAKAFARVD